MSEKDNGGPAFPVPYHPQQEWESPVGMSLRDYFAAKVMQGMMASVEHEVADDDDEETGEVRLEFARGAYAMADAMLEARK